MLNVVLLQRVIDDYCTRTKRPRTALAAAMDMSMPTFYSRTSGESEWKASEMYAFKVETGIDRQTWDAIFFSFDVN